jgi:hypothetical protein
METEKVSVEELFNAVGSMLKDLPFTDCTREQNTITGEWAFRAPEGKAFRVTGRFQIDSDQSDAIYMFRPIESFDLYVARNPQRFQDLLVRNNGDEEAALDEYKWDNDDEEWMDVPKYFDGKLLVVLPDISAAFKVEHSKTDSPSVMVKKDVVATYEHDYFIKLDGVRGSRGETVFYEPATGQNVWTQTFATVVVGFSRIEMVDFEDVQPDLFIPEEKPKEIEIVSFPETTIRGTSFEYAKLYRLTEEERIDAMLRCARFGLPFDDDILGRNGVVVFRRDWVEYEDDKLIDAILATSSTGVLPKEDKLITAKTMQEAISKK